MLLVDIRECDGKLAVGRLDNSHDNKGLAGKGIRRDPGASRVERSCPHHASGCVLSRGGILFIPLAFSSSGGSSGGCRQKLLGVDDSLQISCNKRYACIGVGQNNMVGKQCRDKQLVNLVVELYCT